LPPGGGFVNPLVVNPLVVNPVVVNPVIVIPRIVVSVTTSPASNRWWRIQSR